MSPQLSNMPGDVWVRFVDAAASNYPHQPVTWRAVSPSSRLHGAPIWHDYIGRRLREMWWRQHRSDYPRKDTLSRAWTVVTEMLTPTSPTPSVVPGEDESVEFVWHKGDWDIEVEVGSTETYVWARNRASGETWDGELDELRGLFNDLLANFSR